MTRTVYVEGQPLTVSPAQLINSGGEGMVFEIGDKVLKLYHRPEKRHVEKLQDWLKGGLSARLPGNVYGPLSLVTNRQGRTIGFQMRRLPTSSRPMKQLSNPNAWNKYGYHPAEVIRLLLKVHKSLMQIHQQGVVVGDLNDHNIYFEAASSNGRNPVADYWIDADSYQFGVHPCPVALRPFLDPGLYTVKDLAERPCFDLLTDWYAYTVLVLKCLLQVHPYGGVHRELKTIESRARAGVSIVNSGVTYPTRARPLETLSDELLHHAFQVFEQRARVPFPEHLLTQYGLSLVRCPQCGQSYPSQRRYCPACRRKTNVARISPAEATGEIRLLFRSDGFIEFVTARADGRILAVVRTGHAHKLVKLGPGHTSEEMDLFEGRMRYRFRFFSPRGTGQFLVLGSSRDDQLLILDVSRSRPARLAMVRSARFQGTAVFAASREYLYRIAGNMIMRGSVQYGHYVEDMIATAHKNQTRFWASPFGNVIAGFHRVFADRRFFLIDEDNGEREIVMPSQGMGDSVKRTLMSFTRKTVAVMQEVNQKGRSRVDIHVFDLNGLIQHRSSLPLDADSAPVARLANYPYTLDTSLPRPPFERIPDLPGVTGSDRLHWHPEGVLVQQPDRLYLIKNGAGLDKVS